MSQWDNAGHHKVRQGPSIPCLSPHLEILPRRRDLHERRRSAPQKYRVPFHLHLSGDFAILWPVPPMCAGRDCNRSSHSQLGRRRRRGYGPLIWAGSNSSLRMSRLRRYQEWSSGFPHPGSRCASYIHPHWPKYQAADICVDSTLSRQFDKSYLQSPIRRWGWITQWKSVWASRILYEKFLVSSNSFQ